MFHIEVLDTIDQKDLDTILKVWESSVRATHTFLKEEDITSLIPEVKQGIHYVSKLLCIRDENHRIQGFMGVQDNKIEMLFIHANSRGNGMGKEFIHYAIHILNAKYVDVNEQNPQGVGFYKHMGFDTFERSELDDQGNPFPILHMKLL